MKFDKLYFIISTVLPPLRHSEKFIVLLLMPCGLVRNVTTANDALTRDKGNLGSRN